MSDPKQLLESAIALHRAGRLSEAEAAYRRATEADPACAAAWGNLGFVLQQLGRPDGAAMCFEQITRLQPLNAQGFNHLGISLGMQAKFEEAEGALRTAIALDPKLAVAHVNLGNALRELGKLSDSESACRKAIDLAPDDALAYNNLAATLLAQKRYADALTAAARATELRPQFPEALQNLGSALFAVGRMDESLDALRRAVELAPADAMAQVSLADRLRIAGRLTEALAACRQAIQASPNYAYAHNVQGTVLQQQGLVEEAMEAYRKAAQLNPAHVAASENFLFAHHFVEAIDARTILEAHRQWGMRYAPATARRPRVAKRNRGGKLRVGYASADYRQHAVAYFLRPLIAAHDREQFEVFCYSDLTAPDRITAEFQAMDVTWRDVVSLTDDRFAERVRDDDIDVLIDCAGHTSGNRLTAFALRPAPVLVTFLGYPNTTGVAAVDWRITDSLADPSGECDALHTERLMRLDPCAWCYSPSNAPSTVRDRPDGPITFGSFNKLAKLTPRWARVWSQILNRVGGSRLVIKTAALRDPATQQRVLSLFADGGIEAERIELLGPQIDPVEHLAHYDNVDIALDTFPYHGTTTTCEAMWMGVPVVTMSGRVHVSRVGVSLLSAVGMQEVIAESDEEYVTIATDLANDTKRRAELRRTLRKRMSDSPLMDAAGYTRLFETALKQMWQQA